MSQPDRAISQTLPELNGPLSRELGEAVQTYASTLAVAGPTGLQAIKNGRYPDRPQPAPAPGMSNHLDNPVPTTPNPYTHQPTVQEAPVVAAPQEALAQTEVSQSEVPQVSPEVGAISTTPTISSERQIAPVTNIDAGYTERLGVARTLVDEAYADAA